MKIGYLGPKGTFSFEAVNRVSNEDDSIEYRTINDCFIALQNDEVEKIVVPIENSLQDDKEFCKIAKRFNILLVPASSFGYPGYVRIAYCVSNDMIKRSLPAFEN